MARNDGNRYEVVDGELLVSPSPEFHHQEAVLTLATVLRSYIRSNGIGIVSIAPADIELDERTLVQPEVFAFAWPQGRPPEDRKDVRSLLLAIEVLSPSTARHDRQLKRARYQRQAIPEYWIVDLDSRLFERWRPEDERPEILHDSIEWNPLEGKVALKIDLKAFCSEIL